MDILSKNAALIIIDVQEATAGPIWGKLNNPAAEEKIVRLLELWRKKGLPVFHIQYISPRLASPYHQDAGLDKIKKSVAPLPGETLVVKHFESAFMKTDLEERLKKANLENLIFVGFYTDQCVAATVKTANNLGFKVFVALDGTAAIGCRGYNGKYYEAEDIHQMTLGSLQRDGISIIACDQLQD